MAINRFNDGDVLYAAPLNQMVDEINNNAEESASIKADLTVLNDIVLADNEDYSNIDITNRFSFTDNGAVIGDGTITTSGVFCYSDYVDISDVADSMMSISFMNYTTGSGTRAGFGLVLCDENKNVLVNEIFPLGVRSVYTLLLNIPSNCKYIRTTFGMTENNQGLFHCECLRINDYVGLQKRAYRSGDIHFKFIAHTYNGDNVITNGVLRLPTSYTSNGKPTPIIMNGHGTNGEVSDTTWYSNRTDFNNWVQYLCDNGFAVFDVDNIYSDHTDGEKIELGCPQQINSYKSAFEYIKRRYNVETEALLMGASQGSYSMMNYVLFYPNDVKCACFNGPRVNLEWFYDMYKNLQLASLFGSDTVDYNEYKMKPFDIFHHISTGGVLQTPICPTIWNIGENDGAGRDDVDTFVNTLIYNGYYAEKNVYTGKSHSDVTKPQFESERKNIVRFFKMFC